MTTPEPPEFLERPERGRFELRFEGGVAFANYRAEGKTLFVTHTEVPPAFEDRGVGSRLVRALFDNARSSGRRIVPRCGFVAAWARRHPDYGDVLG